MIRNSAGKADEEVRNWLIKGISETYVAGKEPDCKKFAKYKIQNPCWWQSIASCKR